MKTYPESNLSSLVLSKLESKLHMERNSPLCITRKLIEDFCNNYSKEKGMEPFQVFDSLSPIVTTDQCFDELRIPTDHPSRSPSDTYYITEKEILRTHTSAHQCSLMREGATSFLCVGDVYRRDEVDSSHYPVFHQIEGVRLYSTEPMTTPLALKQRAQQDLQALLTALAQHLFGEVPLRWNSDYFPFTEPSFELEVEFEGKWLEVLGCGVIHDDVIRNAGLDPGSTSGYAFGLGLERLAMVLFNIPDIRLFWSEDARFREQFRAGEKPAKFKPYSKYPGCYKDVSFWLPQTQRDTNELSSGGLEDAPTCAAPFSPNDVHECVRDIGGDVIEKVEMFDQFTHPKSGAISQAYRITYRHMDRSLLNAEVDALQLQIRAALEARLSVTLR